MGRVWMKVKQDAVMKMDVPHSLNFATAMYGFWEMGAEIIPYHFLNEIYDDIARDDIVLDYIDQCREVFRKFGVEPSLPDYPDVLQSFLGRKIRYDTIDHFSSDESLWTKGYFVKPVKEKVFTGTIVHSIRDLIGCGSSYENYEVMISEPIDIAAEWRGFIRYDRPLDLRPYSLLSDNHERTSLAYHYDFAEVNRMMDAFRTWKDRPAACSMDICCTKDGRTLLVECNDAYALGCYGLNDILYAQFISARWSQLLGHEDEYDFGI